MTTHTAAARRVLDGLDADLQHAAAQTGQQLSWTAAEQETRRMLATTIDRRTDVARRYAANRDDPKLAVKLSAELRMLDSTVARLLKAVTVAVPQPESLTTIKARRAVNVRWARERARNAAG